MLPLNAMLLGNTVLRWIIAAGVAAGTTMLLLLIRRTLVPRLGRRAARTGRLLDEFVAGLAARAHFLFFLALGLTATAPFLEFGPRSDRWMELLPGIAGVVQAAFLGHWGIGFVIERRLLGSAHFDPARAGKAAVLGFVLRLALWSLVLLLALDRMGFNITALLASMGIGGVALALAVQSILGDLFASLSITLDRPFVVGDFIIVDQVVGSVEYIGLKTTRIRSLWGEQIVIANGDLLKSRIHNYKRMDERRVQFGFNVPWPTPLEQVEAIPDTVKGIIQALPKTRFDRAHFKEFNDTGLNFEVIYFIPDPDYNLYMDLQQAINLGILKAFQERGIDLGYPVRVLREVPGPRLRL
jgi:small-conductance mechanosensitive channel